LIRSQGRMFWWKKARVENLVTLSLYGIPDFFRSK
jgi:hypothetical protein